MFLNKVEKSLFSDVEFNKSRFKLVYMSLPFKKRIIVLYCR